VENNAMAHETWNIERHIEKGVRATVKVYPTGTAKSNGMRYRMLRGPWENTGKEHRDYYASQMELRVRLAALEAQYLPDRKSRGSQH
jgi:hypothetical protein